MDALLPWWRGLCHRGEVARTLQVSVFDYLDYRSFLRDAYADLKQRQRGFSYRWFSRRAGMSSPNFLKLVMDGQRNLSPQSTEKFAEALGLNGKESAFFRDLVGFDQASTAAEKNRFFERIGAHRRQRAVRALDRRAFEYLSRWYYPAVRELVSCQGFREDPEWIARQMVPSITASEARRALDLLLELGLIERTEDGALRQGEPLLSTGAEVRSLAVGNFHRQMMERASAAIDIVPPDRRDISGVTVSLSPRAFQIVKDKIVALRAELLDLSAAEEQPTQVIQINVQAFPLADIEENDE